MFPFIMFKVFDIYMIIKSRRKDFIQLEPLLLKCNCYNVDFKDLSTTLILLCKYFYTFFDLVCK